MRISLTNPKQFPSVALLDMIGTRIPFIHQYLIVNLFYTYLSFRHQPAACHEKIVLSSELVQNYSLGAAYDSF